MFSNFSFSFVGYVSGNSELIWRTFFITSIDLSKYKPWLSSFLIHSWMWEIFCLILSSSDDSLHWRTPTASSLSKPFTTPRLHRNVGCKIVFYLDTVKILGNIPKYARSVDFSRNMEYPEKICKYANAYNPVSIYNKEL